MSIASINYGSSVLGQSVRNINTQLADLSTQLSTGKLSQTYSGMGTNEGLAIAARSQISNIGGYTDTMTNINTSIQIANQALQSLVSMRSTLRTGVSSSPQNLNSVGQTIAQTTAASQFSAMVGILNTQAGDRYLFSGNAINTPSVASDTDILNGTSTTAGLKTVMAERRAADLGADGLGRLVQSQVAGVITVAEDSSTSPFGLKIAAVSSTLTGATVTGPSGSPVSFSVNLNGVNPNNGDKLTVQFTLPDGTTDQIEVTASSATPPPTGSFAIDNSTPPNPANTVTNLNAALNTAIGNLASTSLLAASAVVAGDAFFSTGSSVMGAFAASQLTTAPAPATPATGATQLSGLSGTDSIPSGFAPNDTITVNGTTLTFVASGATGSQLNVGDSIQTLLSKIDAITGSSKPSTIHGGVITINTDDAASLNITSSNTGALGALGFSTVPVTATQPPLRVNGSPPTSATSLRNGTADTVQWYTGNSGPGSPRSTSTARIDDNLTIQYGIQANEQAIRWQLHQTAVFAAFSVVPSASSDNPNKAMAAFTSRIADKVIAQPGQQTIEDIQTDLAITQNTMKDAGQRQSTAKGMLQKVIDQAESAPTDQIASEILSLQNALQASYQTTSMLAQLSLTKFLPAG